MIFINQKILLFSIGCPNCNILKKKLDDKGISYELNTSEEEMLSLGIDKLPVLKVGEKLLGFSEAVKWVGAQ